MVNENYKHSALTKDIIGCCYSVYDQFGNSFNEIIYHRALCLELKKRNIKFKSEYPMGIFYNGQKIGYKRLDFLIEDKVILEIKSFKEIENRHIVQVINYIKVFKLDVALLVNFGNTKLEFKRIMSPILLKKS